MRYSTNAQTKNYRELHDRILEREGALQRLNAVREETVNELALYRLRHDLKTSGEDLSAEGEGK